MRALTCVAILFGIIAIIAGFFGFIYLIATVIDAATKTLMVTLFFGAAGGCLIIAIILAYLGQRTPQRVVVEAHVDLPRDFDVSEVTCPHCGGSPRREDLEYDRRTGAVTLTCPYCKRVSQLVEEVKW
ncbi:MAG: hypothetical protein ACFE89_06125 [Candidatus Hodarchaeota archaeon]